MRRRAICAALLITASFPSEAFAQSGASDSSQVAQLATPAPKSASKKPAIPAKVQPAWRLRGTSLPTLEYGIAGGETVISFSCQPGTGLVRVVSPVGSRGPRPGDGAAIRLTSGRNRFEIAGTAFSTEAGTDVAVAGTTQIDPRLFTLLRGETTVIDVGGKRRTLPLANGRPIIDAFEKGCSESR